jgi:hypothetical protein
MVKKSRFEKKKKKKKGRTKKKCPNYEFTVQDQQERMDDSTQGIFVFVLLKPNYYTRWLHPCALTTQSHKRQQLGIISSELITSNWPRHGYPFK